MLVNEDETAEHQRPVIVTVRDSVAVVTLNRPEVRNAVSVELARHLERAVLEIEAESQVVAAIITGAGEKAFCAGADLSEVVEGRLNDMFTPVGGFGGFVDAPRTKPWIAAVNGAALAGGFEIVLACDIVVATSSAIFGLPEVKRGLIASAGGLYRLPRAVPKAIALEMILTGNVITASRAYELGLVSRIAEDSQVLSEAYDLAMQVSANAPLAIRASLRLAKAANFFTDEELKTEGDAAQARLQRSSDYDEGSRAFLEKRAPRWTGS